MVPGCGQTETPKTPAGAVPAKVAPEQTIAVEPGTSPAAKPLEPVAAKPSAPASLQESTRAIDFRKFPMPDGETATNKAAAILSYPLRTLDGDQAMQFYRAKFAEDGWKLADQEYVDKEKGHFSYSWTKQGFYMAGGAHKDPMSGSYNVYITHHGNIDSRLLPRIAGAELKNASFSTTYYLADAKPGAVADFTRAELTKAGWREVEVRAGKRKLEPDEYRFVRFIQRGIAIGVNINPNKGKTGVLFGISVVGVELPIMPETHGAIEFIDASGLPVHLFYSTPATPEQVLDFHKKELPALGWTIRAGTDTIADGKAKVILEAPEKAPLRLELLALKDDTFVLITDAPERKEKPATKPKIAKTKPAKEADLVLEKESRIDGKLTKDSPKIENRPAEKHQIKMSPDRTYVIDLESTDFDAYLRILDANGKQVAKDDDSGDNRNARLRFTPDKEGEYQVVATVFGAGAGNYVLKIRVLRTKEEKQP